MVPVRKNIPSIQISKWTGDYQNFRKTMGISVWCSPPLGTWVDHDNGWMSKIMKFADDTKRGKIIGKTETSYSKFQMAHVTGRTRGGWVSTWQSAKLCTWEFTILHTRGVRLEGTEEERDIGVAVTKNLKAAGRASAVLGQLRRNFHYRDRHKFLRLYKQYVRPHLDHTTTSHGRICYPSTWRTGYYFPSNK